MNDIEKLNSVKFNIRKALESQGSDITVDTPFEEYPKYVMELDSGGTLKVTLIEEQSFMGLKPSDEMSFYVARLKGKPFSDPKIDITFDGTSYSVNGSDGVYGDMDSETMIPDFTEYPFVIAVNDDEVMIAVADGAQHTIKVEVKREPVFPKGSIEIVQNGEYNVTNYESAIVDVPASAVVSGTKTIISNGTYDVTAFASAEVNVPSSSPSHGTLHIINNTSGTLYFPKYQFINGAFVYQSTAPVMVSAHGSKDMIIPTDGAGGILIDIMVKSASSSKDITGVLISTQDGTINRLYNLTSSMCLDSANNNTRVYFTLDVRNSTSATITFANPT